MTKLWIGNVAPDTSDDEVKALLTKYGFPECDALERVDGSGSRPAVMVSFDKADAFALEQLQARVHNLYWKNRRLYVTVLASPRWAS